MHQLKTHQTIGGFDFEGPYDLPKQLPEKEGLFAIVCTDTRQYYLLDVGHSINLREAFTDNPKKECWETHKIGALQCAFYIDDNFNTRTYLIALKDLRKKYKKSPCVNV